MLTTSTRRLFALIALAAALAGCVQGPPQVGRGVARADRSGAELGAFDTGLAPADGTGHPWVFSDLGAGTLVDTSKYDFDHDTGEISPAPGAQQYLAALSKADYTIGLIVNVPAEWGRTADAKIFKVIDMIDRAWTGPAPLDWNLFGKITGTGGKRHFEGRFLVPDTDAHRKPHPFLFKKAVELAGDRKTFYMTTIREEAPAARAAGMAAYTVVDHRYLPVDQIDDYVEREQPGGGNGR